MFVYVRHFNSKIPRGVGSKIKEPDTFKLYEGVLYKSCFLILQSQPLGEVPTLPIPPPPPKFNLKFAELKDLLDLTCYILEICLELRSNLSALYDSRFTTNGK